MCIFLWLSFWDFGSGFYIVILVSHTLQVHSFAPPFETADQFFTLWLFCHLHSLAVQFHFLCTLYWLDVLIMHSCDSWDRLESRWGNAFKFLRADFPSSDPAHLVILVLFKHVAIRPPSISGIPSFGRYIFSSRTSRFSSLVWSYGLSGPNLTPSATHSDHSKMAGSSVGTLWIVSTLDAVSTHCSLQLDHCPSFSTIATICASSTKHSCHTASIRTLYNLVHQRQTCLNPTHGTLTRTSVTTRKSTAWLFHELSAHLHSLRSLTSKVVILLPFH